MGKTSRSDHNPYIMGAGRASLDRAIPEVLARLVDRLPAVMIDTLREQWTNLTELDKRIREIEHRLAQWMKQEPAVKAIAEIPGVGLLTATAAVATMGNASVFRSGHEFAAAATRTCELVHASTALAVCFARGKNPIPGRNGCRVEGH